MTELLPGLQLADGVVLSAGQKAWLLAWRQATPATVPIYVTSGTRTAWSQAGAMLKKVQLGDDLYALYADDAAIKTLLSLPLDQDAWARQIQAWMDAGRYLSRHLRSGAVDIRITGLTPAQIDLLRSTAGALGARTLLETLPPHLHVDVPGSGGGHATRTTPSRVPTPAGTPPPSGGGGGGIAVLAVGVGVVAVAAFGWWMLGPALLPLAARSVR